MDGHCQIPGRVLSRLLTGSVAHSTMPKDHFTGPSIVFFCKIGRIANENVITELLKIKCLPYVLRPKKLVLLVSHILNHYTLQ